MKKITLESFYSIIAIGLNSISNFILTYFVAKTLTIESIGTLSFSLSIITFFTGVLIFGFDSAVGRIYWDEVNFDQKSKLLSTWFYSTVIYSTFICVGLYFFAQNTISFRIEDDKIGMITYALIPGKILLFILFNWIRIDDKSILFFYLSLINFAVLVLFICLPAYYFSLSLFHLLLLNTFTTYSFLLFIIYVIRNNLNISFFNKTIFYEILNLSKPLLFVLIVMQVFPFIDRLYIKNLMGEKILGSFHLHLTLTSIFGMLTSAAQQFLGPKVMQIHSENSESITFFNKIREYSFFLFSFLLIFFILSANVMFNTLFPQYDFDLILFVLMGYNFFLIFLLSFANYSLFINKENKIIAKGWHIAFSIKIITLFLFHEFVNIYTLIIASSISYIFLIFFLYNKSEKSIKIWNNQSRYLIFNLLIVIILVSLICFYE
uniref:lipopolysaccharide biosynthesis protein n=1 Tax=Algoriphagus sp. TaxID=1872435 RepID=UPI0040487FF4